MKVTSVILAAGKGTRMRSDTPKVLHELSGQTMLEHVLIAQKTLVDETKVVVSEELILNSTYIYIQDKYKFVPLIQENQRGTADALLVAMRTGILGDYVLMLYGDAPLIQSSTLEKLVKKITEDPNLFMVNLGFYAKDPPGYGRMVLGEGGELLEIVEEKEASDELLRQKLCNSGIMISKAQGLQTLLEQITNDNIAGEFYATDLVKIANKGGYKCGYLVADEEEVLGINDFLQLSYAENILQRINKQKLMLEGVRIIDPQSSYISSDVKIGRNVVIYPNVYIGKGVTIHDNVHIHSFSHIEGAIIGNDSAIGPFARLRTNTVLGESVKIGNFVETKNANLGAKTKASHLSYIGDAELGKGCNIGAGTIFCNYNGKKKSFSHLGNEVFIGSNASIISPVKIGDNSLVAAGSVITKNIEEKELAIARIAQINLKKKSLGSE